MLTVTHAGLVILHVLIDHPSTEHKFLALSSTCLYVYNLLSCLLNPIEPFSFSLFNIFIVVGELPQIVA